jgi:hypothetical protein
MPHPTTYNINDEIKTVANEIKKTTPALDKFTLYSVILQSVVSELTLFVMPTAEGVHDPTVHYLDAAAAILQGGRQLRDKDSHRPLATKIKGFSNVASGISLISCDETVRAARRTADPEYWLSDSLKKWEKLDTVTIPNLEKEIQQLEKTLEFTTKNTATTWVLNRKKERLNQLEQSKKELEHDLITRTTTNKTCWAYYEKHYLNSEDALSKKAQHLIGTESNLKNKIAASNCEEKINKQCQKELRKAIYNSVFIGITFAGALLLCIPGAQPAGAILITISIAMLTAKYADKAIEKVPKIKNQVVHFFQDKQKTTANSGVELETLPPRQKS